MSNIFNILRGKSPRELSFRIFRIAKKKLGLLRKEYKTSPPEIPLLSLSEFRAKKQHYFFQERNDVCIPKNKQVDIEKIANRIMNGEMLFFSQEWINLGKEYDWVTNPVTGYRYDVTRHWSDIETLDENSGDIKYVWEKSRFSYLYYIIRYDYHFSLDHSEFVFNEIINWIDKNPVNCGPNYVCSQEISVRINNWLFALTFYKDSRYLTEDKWNKIIQSVYWQIRHVYSNINFSRIAVRNNHAITETLTLYLFGLLFPEMPYARKWKRDGKRWFEEEIDYQIEDDGTFIQDSMNYHRVVIQLLSIAISIAERNGEIFSETVYQKALKSVNFLYQCQDTASGRLPNYGSNDGALFFPLSSADYRDYRPQLDALHKLLTGGYLYDTPYEETLWLTSNVEMRHRPIEKVVRQSGIVRFDKSGYYLIRDLESLTFVRCGNFKGQGTTDQLHIDIWKEGRNIFIDGGSYLYNTDKATKRYFSGTESHNTVMLNDNDQMLKGPRFMWFYPTKRISVDITETDEGYIFEGRVICFRHLGKDIVLSRQIKKTKGKSEWFVEDLIHNKPEGLAMRQIWHWLPSEAVNICSENKHIENEGRYSSYYGISEPSVQHEIISLDSSIKTHIKL